MTLPHTTKKQKEILHLLYQYRFIDRKQIQTILTHKNHRRIHSWLNDLVEKNCIERIYSNKMPENTKPAVYYLGRNGRKILKEYFTQELDENGKSNEAAIYQLTKTYKDSQRTEVFRNTCLTLVDIAIATAAFAKEHGYDMIFSSITECQTYSLLTKFDSYLSLQKNKGKKKRYVFPDFWV
jgi:hypothetical protein